MGLKTTNYVSKSTGLVLPEAYAVLTNLIQASRTAAKSYKALDTVEIHFEWDRKSDPAKLAYEYAKTETKTAEDFDRATGTITKKVELGVLYGWQDDIV